MATSNNLTAVTLKVVTGDHIPSFKNTKRSGTNPATGKHVTYTPKQIKQRMAQLENRIVSALYSSSQMQKSGTDSECQKQLRTVLCGLYDDSIKQIPEFSFAVRYVEPGLEGVEIIIEEIKCG